MFDEEQRAVAGRKRNSCDVSRGVSDSSMVKNSEPTPSRENETVDERLEYRNQPSSRLIAN